MDEASASDRSTDGVDAGEGIGIGELTGIVVAAPVAVASGLVRCVPKLVTDARARVERRLAVARMVGQMTTTVVDKKVRERVARALGDDASPDRSSDSDAAPPRAGASRESSREPAGATRSAATVTEIARGGDEGLPTSEELPLEDYESLAASHVVRRLPDLSADELASIERFERAHRQRRTVLGKIEQLRAT